MLAPQLTGGAIANGQAQLAVNLADQACGRPATAGQQMFGRTAGPGRAHGGQIGPFAQHVLVVLPEAGQHLQLLEHIVAAAAPQLLDQLDVAGHAGVELGRVDAVMRIARPMHAAAAQRTQIVARARRHRRIKARPHLRRQGVVGHGVGIDTGPLVVQIGIGHEVHLAGGDHLQAARPRQVAQDLHRPADAVEHPLQQVHRETGDAVGALALAVAHPVGPGWRLRVDTDAHRLGRRR
mmetsp:Transcript_29873/g.54146  ORF Transcript_29873/g.54146 Transcript_29873/m.54146 type:complete len:237 (+) Transcript_29873:455-1165(+)